MSRDPKKISILTFILATLSALIVGVLVGRMLLFLPSGGDISIGKSALSLMTSHSLEGFSNLAEKLTPSVVNISTQSNFGDRGQDSGDYFKRYFDQFFKGPGMEPPGYGEESSPYPESLSLGSGFIISEDGLILTDNHVVSEADEVMVSFSELSQEPVKATVVGSDPELDLALLKIKVKRDLVAVTLGDSDVLKVGDYVLAIGNPFGRSHSVTHGIISAKGRDAPDFPLAQYLQTDAPINPGNSGGPLINLHGEVIGIANAIDARAQGIGFAIPINLVKKVLPELKSKGSVARGYIGILANELNEEVAKEIGVPRKTKGPFVSHVYPGEPADLAGIKPYDVILEFNGKKVLSSSDLMRAVTEVEVGKAAPIKIQRGKKIMTFKIKIKDRPQQNQAQKPDTQTFKEPVNTGMIIEDYARREGVLVTEVFRGGPADQAGVQAGDLIFEVNRKKIDTKKQFYSVVKSKKSYLIRVLRQQQDVDRFVVLVLNLSSK